MRNLEDILKGYLEKKSRIMVLDIRILNNKEKLRVATTKSNETDRDIIEGMQLGAVVIETDKPQRSNSFHSATENTAMNYRQEKYYHHDFDVFALKKEILYWEKEKSELEAEIKEIDLALKSLNKEEEFVITMFYIEKMFWRNIVMNFEINFKLFKCERTLKTIRDEAGEKLKRVIA